MNDKTILLVDDSLLTSKIVSEFLYENGYTTETVATGEDAIKEANRILPDLILMDIELAGNINGIDAARTIIKNIDIPVVFFTANSSKEIIHKIKEIKAYGFVLKGMDKAALLYTIEMALNLHEANTQTQMFQKIFENLKNELYLFDSETFQFAAANHAARKNIGYKSIELNALSFFDIQAKTDQENLQKILHELKSGEQQQVIFNTLHQRKNGSSYPVETYLQLLDYGKHKLLLVLAIDLTERSAMKAQLNERELVLDAIIRSAQDAIVMVDRKGNTTLWNSAAEQIFGYSKEEMLGNQLQDIFINKVYQNILKNLKSIENSNFKGKIIELQAKHKEGHILDLEVSMSILKIKEQFHVISLVRNISERKRAHEDLKNSRKQYLELAENAPVGILTCDNKGNIIYVNFKAMEILGSPDENKTKQINLLTFPALVQYGLSAKLKDCLDNNLLGVYEMNYESIWGKKIWMRLHIKPLTDRENVVGAQIIIDDITEKKNLEKELRTLSLTDPLTNVYNRRYFIQKLEEEITRVQGHDDSTFCIVMLDIDHFKSINDRFGHYAGDAVLKKLTEIMKSKIRTNDCLARWGGEEFILLLQDMPLNQAVLFVEELRKSICGMESPIDDQVTASLGVVEYSCVDTIDSIIQKADNLMYVAKNAGRNCVQS